MKNAFTLIALSTLALAACTETTPGTNPSSPLNPPVTDNVANPLAPVSGPGVTNPPVVNDDVVNPPVIDGPTVVSPPIIDGPEITDAPVTGGLSGLTNGVSSQAVETVWVCEEAGDPEITYLGFFSDSSGLIGDGEAFEPMQWSASGPYVEIYYAGEYFAQLDNINVASTSLTLSYTQFDGTSGNLSCDLAEVDSTATSPSGSGGTAPGFQQDDPDVGSGDDFQDVDSQSGQGGQGTVVNSVAGGDLLDFWTCDLAKNDFVAMFFLQSGEAGLFTDDYPDGIIGSWTMSGQGVALTLTDGNQFSFASPQFDDGEFYTSSVTYNGSSISGMDCVLTPL